MRVSACDSRIALPPCPQAKKLEAAGKAPPIRRDVDGASVPRVAYVLLLLVNFCHSNSRCTGYREPAAYTTRVPGFSASKVSGHPEHLLHVSPAQNCEDRKARFQKQRLGASLEKTCRTDFFLCWKSRHPWTALGMVSAASVCTLQVCGQRIGAPSQN